MEPLPQDVRLVRRAFWLIRLRWVAVLGLFITAFIAHDIMSIGLNIIPIYVIGVCLVVYNTLVLLLLRRLKKNHIKDGMPRLTVRQFIHFQMSTDLLILTVLFHYSGGIENPFIIYYVFHMIIASILLSELESYLQALFACGLLTLLATLEYRDIIPHHCLLNFVAYDQHEYAPFVFGTVAVVSSALFLVVFMASSISTRLRKQEEAYWQANQLLEQKDRIKDEYVERVTHDIKGHLAAIKGTLDVVAKGFTGSLEPKQKEFLDRALNRTTILATFVRQLLKLTQMRLNNERESEKFSIDEAIENAMQATKDRASQKKIQLQRQVEGESFYVSGDRLSIEEMITNLIFNAVKYTPESGNIEVKAVENEENIIVSIKDTGIGIPEDELPRIFEEFYRASNARTQEKDGSGLGLSIAKQIVEDHSGKIWAESKLGQGTTVIFSLPKKLDSTNLK